MVIITNQSGIGRGLLYSLSRGLLRGAGPCSSNCLGPGLKSTRDRNFLFRNRPKHPWPRAKALPPGNGCLEAGVNWGSTWPDRWVRRRQGPLERCSGGLAAGWRPIPLVENGLGRHAELPWRGRL